MGRSFVTIPTVIVVTRVILVQLEWATAVPKNTASAAPNCKSLAATTHRGQFVILLDVVVIIIPSLAHHRQPTALQQNIALQNQTSHVAKPQWWCSEMIDGDDGDYWWCKMIYWWWLESTLEFFGLLSPWLLGSSCDQAGHEFHWWWLTFVF